MEESINSSLKSSLSSVSAKALNFSSRLVLSNNLDYKQVLPSRKGYARDYRGLAELMGFQYKIIKKFGESENPTMKIIDSWETHADATLDKLISFLEEMDRYDVITELTPFLEKNVETYIQYQKSLESPIQVAEVTPGPMNLHSERGVLTRDDWRSGECTIYDAYVSYADEDSHIVAEFAHQLESPNVGLKLFIRGRDMLAGCAELDTNIELIKYRCRHMLILLTPNFIKSPALEFQVSFAGSLAIEQKQRILIPVILAPCEIPLILNSVSKIDFTKDLIHDWMWDKLIVSLLPEAKSGFFPSLSRSPLRNRNMLINSGGAITGQSVPIITYPQTVKHSLCSADTSGTVLAITSSDSNDNENGTCVEINNSKACIEVKEASTSKTSPSTKRFHSFMSFLKRKGNSSNATSSSFVSGATSGFHSQSSNDIRSFDNTRDNFTDDTSL